MTQSFVYTLLRMNKAHYRTYTLIHTLLDISIVAISWWIAYWFRFESGLIPNAFADATLYFKLFIVHLLISHYYFRTHGLYSSQRFQGLGPQSISIVRASFSSFLAMVVLVYFISSEKVSRIFLINHQVLSVVLLLASNIFLRNWLRRLRRSGKNIKNAILVGKSGQVQRYFKSIMARPEFGVKIVGWVQPPEEFLKDYDHIKYPIKRLEHFDKKLIEDQKIEIVVIGKTWQQSADVEEIIKISQNLLIEVMVLPDVSQSLIGFDISDVAGVPVINMNMPRFSTASILAKRLFDFTAAFLGLIIISPLLFVIGLLVKITSPGPIFYSQTRMGLNGKQFKMYKFRSMIAGASNAEGWTQKNDPRRTRFGTLLRKTSLDELPQLWNVLIGDMSLVGPRPERPQYVKEFNDQIPAYMLRHRMKAGITGWAQINGWRGDTSIAKRIEYDLFYIKNWSLVFDVVILVLTFFKGLRDKNAY